MRTSAIINRRKHNTKINNRKSKAIKTVNVYCDGELNDPLGTQWRDRETDDGRDTT